MTAPLLRRLDQKRVVADAPTGAALQALKSFNPKGRNQLVGGPVSRVMTVTKALLETTLRTGGDPTAWQAALDTTMIRSGRRSTRLRTVIASSAFRQNIEDLYEAWAYRKLVEKANYRANTRVKDRSKAPLPQVERLIQVGRLLTALATRRPGVAAPGALRQMLTAPLTLPASWSAPARRDHAKGARAVVVAPLPADAPLTGSGARQANRHATRSAMRERDAIEELIERSQWLYTFLLKTRSKSKTAKVKVQKRLRFLGERLQAELAKVKMPQNANNVWLQLSTALLDTKAAAPAKVSFARTIVTTPVVQVNAAFNTQLRRLVGQDAAKALASILKEVSQQLPMGINEWIRILSGHSKLKEQAGGSLCSTIQVYEGEVSDELPPAQSPAADGERLSIRNIGVGDLMLVRERLVDYATAEIGHIENVLRSEERLREHERITRREEVTETETQEESRSVRDLQTSDRAELQSQVQKAITEQFSVQAGLNVSGKYGVTTVEASVDAGFSRSSAESTSTTAKTAREVISRTVEETFKSVREQRRLTLVEQVRELNRHGFNNTGGPSFSGVYYFVEEVRECEIRHYGSRMMIEFFIPEPGLSLLPSSNLANASLRKPAPLTIGPNDIDDSNYLCLTELYGAVGVEPPPPRKASVGWAWASSPDNYANEGEDDAVFGSVAIPAGYAATQATAYFGGAQGDDSASCTISFAGIAVAPRISFSENGNATAQVSLGSIVAPTGLPIAMWMHGHWDRTAAVNVRIDCQRTAQAFDDWRLNTYERLREAHATLVSNYERRLAEQEIRQAGPPIGRAPAENRRREKDELKKWAIKAMRQQPFAFDAVVGVSGEPEVDPVRADEYAPVVRFFEQAFEWTEMAYFLHPYYWGRRSSWAFRRNVADPDPRFEQFLRAGSARVVVPVTPNFERQVMHYLRPADVAESELTRVTWTPPTDPEDTSGIAETADAKAVWIDILRQAQRDVALGHGTLSVQNGQPLITINADSLWVPDEMDVGREIFVNAVPYQIVAFDATAGQVTIDRPFEGPTDPQVVYGTGSVRLGTPWRIRIPTSQVILAEERAKLVVI